jgi:hypothetical protein
MARHAAKRGLKAQIGAFAVATLLAVSGLAVSQASSAIDPIELGTAANFAVLAGTGITNTGATGISGTGGDIGSYPTRAFTGADAVASSGEKYIAADVSEATVNILSAAKADLKTAYDEAVKLRGDSRAIKIPITFPESDKTLTPGLYEAAATFSLAGGHVLQLDGDEDSIFIFLIGADLSLAAASKIILTGGTQAKNVYWQVSSSATFAAGAEFAGRIMAQTTITAASAASFDGQLLAMDGAVTLDTNNMVNNTNSAAPTASSVASPTGTATIGSSLSNAVTFSGEPSPALGYAWEFSADESTWVEIADATESTFTLTDDQVGGYLRTVVTATNVAGALTRTSTAIGPVLPPAPSSPVLVSASDSGSSDIDRITAVTQPEISLSGLIVGMDAVVTATQGDRTRTCSFKATATAQSCSFTESLTDGTWLLTAVNALSGFSSANSGSLSITIDTAAPAVQTFTLDQESINEAEITHSLVFTKSVTGLEAADFTVDSNAVSCDAPTLLGSGAEYTITVANCTGDGDLRLELRANSIVDLAGNIGPGETYLTTAATIDATAPVVLFVDSSTSDGSFTQGAEIRIQIRFSEPVNVSGIPKITLETGATDRVVDYVSGSGTNELTFVYSVQSGDNSADLDYVSSTALALAGGTIADSAGNNAVLTLPLPGTTGSLAEKSSFVVDGESLLLELLRSDAESETQSISWTLTAPAALNCETLSREAGVDFDFRKLTSIDSIVSSDGGNSCTITATSSVGTAQFGTSSLSIAGDFSVQDAAGRTHATVTSGDTDILVTIEAHSGEGHVSTDAVLGDAPGQIATELSRGLFSGSFGPTPSQMISLEATGLVNAHQDVRGETLMVDNSKFTFHGDPLASRSPHHLTAGESIILKLKVAHEVADVSSLAIFVKTGVDSWTYAGSGAFDKETFIASTGAFSLHDGIYNIRLFVVSKSWSIAPVSLNSDFGGFLGRFTPTLTTMSISESGLPQVNKSHEAVIYVTSSTDPVQPTDPAEPTGPAEPTVPDDSSSGDSGSDSDVDQEPSPVETEEPAPAETEEPGPVETEDPEQSSPGSVTETETGGQLPDTDTTGFNWLVPLGIAGGLAVLGAIVFLSRRRLV